MQLFTPPANSDPLNPPGSPESAVGGPPAFTPPANSAEADTMNIEPTPQPVTPLTAQQRATRKGFNDTLAKNERDYKASMTEATTLPGYLTSIASFGDTMGGVTPYLAAVPKMFTNDKTYAQNVGDAKRVLETSQKAHPNYSIPGTVAGILASLPLGGEATLAKSLGIGGTFGLTQGGTGLEDLISGKGNIVGPALQAAIGAGIAYPAHLIGQKISPEAVKDAAKYAQELGVSLPAGIMNAGQRGYGHLTKAASQTVSDIGQKFRDLTSPLGDLTPVTAAQNAIEGFIQYAGRNVHPSLVKAINEAPELAFDSIVKVPAKALVQMKDALIRNGADKTWQDLQNGFMRHVANVSDKGSFSFGELSKRLGEVPKETRNILLEGYDDGQKLLGDVFNLGRSTMHSGQNLIDAAAYGVGVAQKKVGKVRNFINKTVTSPYAQYLAYNNLAAIPFAKALPLAIAGYGVKKGAQATGRALDKRNVASPTLSKIVNNAALAGERYVTSKAGDAIEGITSYTQPAIKNAIKTIGNKKSEKWWSENMPAILGGKAEGGRIAYKSGGKVGSIEPLVQELMKKAKMAKKVSNKATEPLLNERDDAIARALAVAQKAI